MAYGMLFFFYYTLQRPELSVEVLFVVMFIIFSILWY